VIAAPTYGWWQHTMDHLRHLVLPVTALVLMTCAGIARFQRAAMLDAIQLEFVVTARAK